MTFHVAQINVARLREPLDRPSMQAFVDGLEPINTLADASPGFVWRLQTDDGDATALRVFDDDMIIVNMSVWDSVEALHAFVFRSEHAGYLRRRSEWFEKLAEASTALWWIRAGETPMVEDAKTKLESLRARGPTREGFTSAMRSRRRRAHTRERGAMSPATMIPTVAITITAIAARRSIVWAT